MAASKRYHKNLYVQHDGSGLMGTNMESFLLFLERNGQSLGGGGSAPSVSGIYYVDSDLNVQPLKLLDNNILSTSLKYLVNGDTVDLVITGQNFTGSTAFDFGAGVTVNTTTIHTSSSATVNITPSTFGDKTIQASVFGDAEGSSVVVPVMESVQIPGDGTTSWENVVNVTVGEGTILKAGGSDWQSGASFGSVASGKNYRLDFNCHSTGIQKSIVGLAAVHGGVGWESVQYGLYFGSTNLSITSIENGTVGSVIAGGYTTGDAISIRRDGTLVRAYRNNVLIHTYADASSEASLIAEIAVNSGLDYRNVVLRY